MSPSSDAAWDIYAEQMVRTKLGIGLWRPNPTTSYRKIRIGHIGYIRMGRFRMIFDANGPIGDRVPGRDVPEDFVPLPQEYVLAEEDDRPPQRLHMDSSRRGGIEVQSPSGVSPAPVSGVLSFQSSGSKGALLITQDKVKVFDAERERIFRMYIKKHHASWVKFAQDTGHDVELKDIILITGHDTTREYAMAAFANNSSALRIEFKAGYEGIGSASASVWGTWEASPLVYHTCGPLGSTSRDTNASILTPPSGPEDFENTPAEPSSGNASEEFTQCIFIRGFHIRKRMQILPIVLRAAAGNDDPGFNDGSQSSSEPVRASQELQDDPSPDNSDNITLLSWQDEGETEPVSISDTSTFSDPLEPIFNYIFETSDANFAIAHDLDISRLTKLAEVDHFEDISALLSMVHPEVLTDADGIARLKFDSTHSPDVESPESLGEVKQLDGESAHTCTKEFRDILEKCMDDNLNMEARESPGDDTKNHSRTEVSLNTFNQSHTEPSKQTPAIEPTTTDSSAPLPLIVPSMPIAARRVNLQSPLSHQSQIDQQTLHPLVDPLAEAQHNFSLPLSPSSQSRCRPRNLSVSFVEQSTRQSPNLAVHCPGLYVRHERPPCRILMDEQRDFFEFLTARSSSIKRPAENFPYDGRYGKPLFTATVDGYIASLLCEHEALFTLSVRHASIVTDNSRANINIASPVDFQVTFRVSLDKLANGENLEKSLIRLDLRSASLLGLTSGIDPNVSSDQLLQSYLTKYMEELQKSNSHIEVQISHSDDFKLGYGHWPMYAFPEGLKSDMIHFTRSAAVNKYMAKRWRRAVLPEHPKDQLLAPLAEISSSWAINTNIENSFLIHFDTPEVRPCCAHSVLLYLDIEDISFFTDDETSTPPLVYRAWRLAFILRTFEAKKGNETQIKLDMKSARFSSYNSSMGSNVALNLLPNVVAFLKDDYLPMLGRMSLDTIYSSVRKVEAHIPTRAPEYMEQVNLDDGDFDPQRHPLDKSIQAYGFDQIMAVSEEAINRIFSSVWLEARGSRVENLMTTFSTPAVTASFEAPVIRLLSSGKAVVWFQMTQGILFKWTDDLPGSLKGFGNSSTDSDGGEDRAIADYVIQAACSFAFEVDLTIIEDHKLFIVDQLRSRSRQAGAWSFISNNKDSYQVKHLQLDLRNGEFIPELSIVSGIGKGHAGVLRLSSMLGHMRKYMAQLADGGYGIAFSIPVWTDRATINASTLTDFNYQVITKSEIIRQNCSIDRDVHDCPVVLILGSHGFRPLPQVTVPWNDGWFMRDKVRTTLSTIYLSRDTFLEPLLLPILKTINKRTTLTPKNASMIDGQWILDVETLENTFQFNKQACDWRADKREDSGDNLHYTWSYSEEVVRRYRDMDDSEHVKRVQEASLCCQTKNALIIPTLSYPDRLDIHLTGESVLTLAITGEDDLLYSSRAQWAGTMRIVPGSSGFIATFVNKIKPTWTCDKSSSDIARLHKQNLGETITIDDIAMATAMYKFLCPGSRDYSISSPMIRPSGSLILQVYEKTFVPPSRQSSMKDPKPFKLEVPYEAQKRFEDREPPSNNMWGHKELPPKINDDSISSASKSAAKYQKQEDPWAIWLPPQASSGIRQLRYRRSYLGSPGTKRTPQDWKSMNTLGLSGLRRADSPGQVSTPRSDSPESYTPPPAYGSLPKATYVGKQLEDESQRLIRSYLAHTRDTPDAT